MSIFHLLCRLFPLWVLATLSLPLTSYAQTVVTSHDFNSDNNGWTLSTGTGTNWQRGTNAAFTTGATGSYMYFNPQQDNLNKSVSSSSLSFSTYSNLVLQLSIHIDTYDFDGDHQTSNHEDGMRVEYSISGGSWTTLGAVSDGFNWYNNTDHEGFGNGEDGWSGLNNSWRTAYISLPSAMNGQSDVQFRLRYVSTSATRDGDGVAFDNFQITSYTFPAPTPGLSPGNVSANLSLWLRADAGLVLNGSTVAGWTDQSGLGNNALQGLSSSQPLLVEDELNGNDVLDFITDDWIEGVAGFNTAEYFMVVKPEFNASATSTTGNIIGFERGQWTSFALGPTTGAFSNEVVTHRYRTSADYRAAENSSTKVYNEPVIFNGHHNSISSPTNMLIKANGADIVNATVNTFTSLSNQSYRVADDMNSATDANDSGPFDGKIAEVISYSTTLTDAQRRDVTTYLAIKYGISLDISSLGYTAGGTNIYDHVEYPNDIAGIGANSASQGLVQANSKSVNNGTIVRMREPSDMIDGEYLVWGNDGGTTAFITSNVPVGAYERLGRIWRVAETGEVGTVTISFDVTSLGVNISNSTINLFIVPSSGTVPAAFSSATVVTGGVYSVDAQGRSLLTFEGVNFANGDYFTIGGDIQTNSPGGTSIPPSMWLRADEGVVHTSNAVSKWTDYGGGGNDIIQGNTPQQPTRVPDAINFNDALDFSGDFMDGASGFYTQDYFVVMRADITINTANQPGFVLGFEPNQFSGLAFGPESGLLTNEVIFQAVGGQASGYHQGSNTGTLTGVNIINSRNNSFANAQEVYVNGVVQSSTSSGTFASLSNQPFRVGNNFTSTRAYDGQIAEIISFNSRLSDIERRDVETYLALKYGLTLNIASAGYTDNGSVIYGYTTHPNGIAGVGQNLNNSFLQEESMSGIVKMEFPTDLDDEEYIIWGRNTGSESTVQATEVPTGVTNRLEGEWRVDKSGEPGLVTVKMYVAGINQYSSRQKEASLYSLLIDADGDFSSGATVKSGVSFSGDTIVFSNVSFNDGDFFTLGVPPVVALPGTGATVWLKAHEAAYSNAGTTLATNGNTVQQWNNQVSATLTNVAQVIANSRPTYNANALNGYPVITFDGTDDILFSADVNQPNIMSNTAGSVFTVMERNAVGHYISWRRDGNRRLILRDDGSTGYTFNYATLTVNAANNYNGEYVLVKGLFTASSASSISVNSTEIGTGTAPASLGMNSRAFNIGARSAGNDHANMDIAEVIVYNTTLSPADQATVETYLSLKYGLPKSLPLEVAGTTIYNNASYGNDVAGIGAEATLGYYKDESRSVNSDDIVSVSDPSSLNSGDYLVWGNDNGGTATTTSGLPAGITERMTRIWSAVQTNDVGTVTMTFDLASLSPLYDNYVTGDFSLILDSDNNPGNGITGTITASGYTDGIVTFTGVDFGSGTSYFSLGTGRDLTTDTDADGIPDYFEVSYGSDPASINSPIASGNLDGDISTTNGPAADGITDGLEFILVANGAEAPVTRLTDSDSDGIADYIEVQNGSDPFNGNSPFSNATGDGDEDGLPDLVEIFIALVNLDLDPWDYDWGVDIDGDGIPDDIETLAGWTTSDADDPVASGASDTDGDGVLDGIEYLLQFIDTTYGVMDIGTDTDGDGAPDYFEYLNGFGSNDGDSPVGGGDPDTDINNATGPAGDGVSDALEAAIIAFGIPGPITSQSDFDGDGIPDFIEALTYTDPMNLNSPEIPGSMDIRALQADFQTNGANCLDLNGYQWFHITDNVGNLVFSINTVGHDLGSTCFAVRILSGSESIRSDETHYILNRNFWITPTSQPDLLTLNHRVYLRLYTLNDENQELKDRVGEDFMDYLGLDLGDFVADSVKFTKISGVAESLDPFIEGGDRELIHPVAVEFGSTATAYTFGVSSFSNLIPHNAPNNSEDPLPVEWLSFSGISIDRIVKLDWSTASEENNDFFEVERSYNGTNYVVIGRVNGSGTTTEISMYEYDDTSAPSGVLYYRLRQVDYDGKFDYSSVIRVENVFGGKNLDIAIYPNPARGSVYLRLDTGDHTSSPFVTVYDLYGKVVYAAELSTEVISSDVELFNAGLLKSGIYLVNIKQDSLEKTVRLIVD